MKKECFLRLLPPAVFALFSGAFLYRDLWFDEALTLLNFALIQPAFGIYFNYVIPNNQILHTFLLRGWFELMPAGVEVTFFLRLLPWLTGIATLAALYFGFRRRIGRQALLPALTALAVSLPFLIYATALRGYIAGAFGVTLALISALHYAESGSRKALAGHALAALFTVGTIPSNLVALAGAGLYLLPVFGKDFWKNRRFWILVLVPNLAFLVFYLPIWKAFLGICRLGEGWGSAPAALLAVTTAVAASFFVLLFPALAALKHRFRFRWVRGTVWLLAALFIFLSPTVPFPRVLFPFFPLFTLLVAGGIADFFALTRRYFPVKKILFLLMAAILLWGGVMMQLPVRSFLCRQFGGGRWMDDYFLGYYTESRHSPSATVEKLAVMAKRQPLPAVYLSFCADPWPLLFYGKLYGIADENWHFDGPRGAVTSLPAGAVAILRFDEDPQVLEKRFSRSLKPLFSQGFHHVFCCE